MNKNEKSDINYTIYTLKLIAALFVVLIHTSGYIFSLGTATIRNFYSYRTILPLAVPFFFMVTGYFVAHKSTEQLKRYIFNIFSLWLSSSVFYFISGLIISVPTNRETMGLDFFPAVRYYLNGFTMTFLVRGVVGYYHLWYLAACFFALLVVYAVRSRLSISATTLVATIFFVAFYYLREQGNTRVNIFADFALAFPCIALGMYIKEKENDIKIKHPVVWSFFFIVVYHVVVLKRVFQVYQDFILLTAVFFIVFSCSRHKGHETILSRWGKNMPTKYIYYMPLYYPIFIYSTRCQG